MSTHPTERRKQSRRISDQGIEDLLNTFSTPQCHSCLEHLGGAVLLLGKDREVLHATPSMKTLARKCNALLSLKPRFELLDAQKNPEKYRVSVVRRFETVFAFWSGGSGSIGCRLDYAAFS